MTVTIRIGFTGTRKGMTKPQLIAVHRYLQGVLLVNDWEDPVIEAHHGDCTGADAQFHVIATVLGCRTIAHPPVATALRAWCPADEIREPKGYLARDWDIVHEAGEMLAAPKTADPEPHSGTWTTIGYAVRAGHPAKVFMPHDGSPVPGSDLLRVRTGP
jgi:hypothetical protein